MLFIFPRVNAGSFAKPSQTVCLILSRVQTLVKYIFLQQLLYISVSRMFRYIASARASIDQCGTEFIQPDQPRHSLSNTSYCYESFSYRYRNRASLEPNDGLIKKPISNVLHHVYTVYLPILSFSVKINGSPDELTAKRRQHTIRKMNE